MCPCWVIYGCVCLLVEFINGVVQLLDEFVWDVVAAIPVKAVAGDFKPGFLES